MDTGSFYGPGFSFPPGFQMQVNNQPALPHTPPVTPTSQGRSIGLSQKLDMLMSMFTEQKNASNSASEKLQQQLTGLASEITDVKKRLDSVQQSAQLHSGKGKRKKLPHQLSTTLKRLHEKAEHQFQGSEKFESPSNQHVKDHLLSQLKLKFAKQYSPGRYRKAVHRYYESHRRLFNDSLPHRVEKAQETKLKSKKQVRRKQLYERRKRFLKNKEEKDMWEQINPSFMTEESGQEDEEVIYQHSLPWRREKLNKLCKKADKRWKQSTKTSVFPTKRRELALPSTQLIPEDAPDWAINPSFVISPESTAESIDHNRCGSSATSGGSSDSSNNSDSEE